MLKVMSIVRRLLTPYGISAIHKARNLTRMKDIYRSGYEKRVLISYIKEPFRRNSFVHTNFYEATTAAKIFDSLGYRVDVIHYEGRVPCLDGYDVIYGFGDVFQTYFESRKSVAKTIFYGTGMHTSHQNNATLRRVRDVYKKTGVWLCGSARYIEKSWTHQTALVDGIIALGNERCAETYKKHYDGPVLACPAPFFQTVDYKEIMSCRKPKAHKSYLWFGSAGLIHKGLDLCLEYFQNNPDVELHVCGNISLEPDFVSVYYEALYSCPNIHVHGFVDINSDVFKDILASCSFVIFPSCSEGGSPSVLTAIGNGALIPVISYESSVNTEYGVVIYFLTPDGLSDAIAKTREMSISEIETLQCANAEYVVNENSLHNYERILKSQIVYLLDINK